MWQIQRFSGVTVGLSLLLGGCRTDCDPTICPVIDQSAGASDARIEFSPGTVITVAFGDVDGLVTTTGGEVVLHASDSRCFESATMPCEITLKRLQLKLETFTVESSVGAMELAQVTIAIEAPITLQSDGFGYVIPTGVKVHTCLEVDGIKDHGEAVTKELVSLSVSRFWGMVLSFEGRLPFVFHATNSICQEVQGQVAGLIGGKTPWAQVP